MKELLQKPLISVVIPCYNEEFYIGEALRTLNEQITDFDYEVIVVDNNCDDNSVAIAKKYGARVIEEKIPGVCAARQTGTKAARAEIVVSTDSDSRFKPNWLQSIYNEFKSNPSIIAVAGPCSYYDGPWWGKGYTKILFTFSWLYSKLTGHPFYITATNIAFKKTAWTGYDNNLPQGGDELGLLKQLKRHGKIIFKFHNGILTSGRRLTKGALYNLFVTCMYYYFFAYIINSLFKRQIIGMAPVFRKNQERSPYFKYALRLCMVIVPGIVVYYGFTPIAHFLNDNTVDISKFLMRNY